jgi:hypothetical protein
MPTTAVIRFLDDFVAFCVAVAKPRHDPRGDRRREGSFVPAKARAFACDHGDAGGSVRDGPCQGHEKT